MHPNKSPMSRLERVVAASIAFREFCARWRAGTAESLSTWLTQHAELGDALDEAVITPTDDDDQATEPTSPPSRTGDDATYPTEVGGFKLLEELDAGAHGSVWRARGPRHEGDVALKILHPHALRDADLRARFSREAHVAARLQHQNLCRVVAFDDTCTPPWLAMEFVPGQTLDKTLAASPRPPSDLAEISSWVALVRKLADGLDAAHAHDLVHRDVKPRNVMVKPDGEPVLVDFGLVREASTAGQLTLTGDHMGTIVYMAPEQVEGQQIDSRADVWALGVILFECLAGRPPFQSPTREGLAVAITRDAPPSLKRLNRAVPNQLAVVVETALRKSVRQRYRTAADLAEDLRRWLEGERVLARRPSVGRTFARWCNRNPLPAALLGALAASLIGMSWFGTREASARGRETTALGREAQARARAEAGEAARTFDAARLEASYGRWQVAEALYGRARELRFDPTAVDLGLVEVWDATFRADESFAVLERLDARADLGRHRAMVTLLRNDFSRQMIGESGPVQWRQSGKAVQAIINSPHLEPVWGEYARALAATTMAAARDHLKQALAIDRRHRATNEMWGPVVLLLEGPEMALRAAREFGVMYPNDQAPVFIEALALSMLGRTAEAEARMSAAQLPDVVRNQIAIVAGVRAGVQAAWSQLTAGALELQIAVVPGQVGSEARLRASFMKSLFGAFTKAALPPLQHALRAEAEGTGEEDARVLFRLPLAAMTGMLGSLVGIGTRAMTGKFEAEGFDQWVAELPMCSFQGMRGIARLRNNDFAGAIRDLANAAARDDLVGLSHPLAIWRVTAAVGWYASYADPAQAADTRAEVATAVDDALRSSEPFTWQELSFLARAAAMAGQPRKTRELAARLVADHPEDPKAAATAIGALACARLFSLARQDLEEARVRWPDERALVEAAAEIDKFEGQAASRPSKR